MMDRWDGAHEMLVMRLRDEGSNVAVRIYEEPSEG